MEWSPRMDVFQRLQDLDADIFMLKELNNESQGMVTTALVSMPWTLADRPCLPLGVLKSYLARHSVPVNAYHLHLSVAHKLGRADYDRIAMNWGLSEGLYSCLYAPEESERILRALNMSDSITRAFLQKLEQVTLSCLNEMDFLSCKLIGFSVAHLQLMASLFAARYIKKNCPDITIVFGGRGVVGSMGKNLLEACGDVDMIVNGEGENALLGLCNVSNLSDEVSLSRVPNLIFRASDGNLKETLRDEGVVPGDIAAPDYDDFYFMASRLGIPAAKTVLPIEASRGCSWEYRRGENRPAPCVFCGLNSSWSNYREKSVDRVLAEIRSGVERYQSADISFVDSCLPESYRDVLLEQLSSADEDITIFCELRPDFQEKTARLLARTGVRKVQIGIEAFSSTLLKRIGKGVRAIDNVYSMKLCMTHNIPFQYNLLTHVPGSTQQEIIETMSTITRLFSFQPPHAIPFFLSRGSWVRSCPQSFGIDPTSLDRKKPEYLPEFLAEKNITEDVSFECIQQTALDAAWERVVQLVDIWSKEYTSVSSRFEHSYPLTYRRAGNFVSICDLREWAQNYITLTGAEMAVFLACENIQEQQDIEKTFDSGMVSDILERFEQLGLVMRDDHSIISLPIRSNRLSMMKSVGGT